ncbi:uncharacterized protein LOC119692242 [Plutella xylostella]|uniref:uncharacterized protein LOC119692242 n=1 Tax=Plutella xylostella TaxID=51655 RepID=UPI0020322B1D|nr:uncharacterized protein LOC119692242 [Plutella xylostella]
MKRAALAALTGFLSKTTLHGFKYLNAPCKGDRLLWLLVCASSACCAGVLCAVLWWRFTQVPTVLSLQTTDYTGAMPDVGVCVPANDVAEAVVDSLSYNRSQQSISALDRILRGLPAPETDLSHLEQLFKDNNLTLQSALLRVTPSCEGVVKRCRLDSVEVPCEGVVKREVTMFGVCCIVRPVRNDQSNSKSTIKQLELVLNCSSELGCHGFDLIAQSPGSAWVPVSSLDSGFLYEAALKFHSVRGHGDQVIDPSCVEGDGYSRSGCMKACREQACGCTDPLVTLEDSSLPRGDKLPPCLMVQLACLRTFKRVGACSHCIRSCKTITTAMSLKQSRLDALQFTYDPFYINTSGSGYIAVELRVRRAGSHVFARTPTESWLTLLSSLGGVFNMFLGVGLFSALELVYFLAVKTPAAIRKGMEMRVTSAPVRRVDSRQHPFEIG